MLAGLDPSGGAGLLLDIKMLTLLGIKSAGIPTTLTFQTTKTFEDWVTVEKKHFERMLKLTLEDMPLTGVKIGMIGCPEILSLIAHYLKKFRDQIKWIVLDPVLKATLKKDLYRGEEFLELLKEDLFPLVDILTPNIAEAQVLTELKIEKFPEDLHKACLRLKAYGVKYPIITGYRRRGRIYNYFLGERPKIYSVRELPLEFHGTGCALSSLILGYLLLGNSPEKAMQRAIQKLSLLLKKGASLKASSGLQLIL